MNTSFPLKAAWPWQDRPRETAAAVLLSAIAVGALGSAVDAMPTLGRFAEPVTASQRAEQPAPAAATATAIRDLDPAAALALNARIPVSHAAAGAAAPFSLGKASASARAEALECLTSAVYYEAAQESDDGQRAVAQVILNRVRHAAFPSSVCGVVYEGSTRQSGCQFTFTCDGSLTRTPARGAWDRARANASSMLNGAVYAPVGNATHYHANYVVPYWASSLVKTQVVGAHLFYRWSGGWGQPQAFAQRYSGREASARSLRAAALAVPHVVPKPLLTAGKGAASLDKLDGVKVTAATGGRVTAHFSPQAREAVEKVKVVPYSERVSASQNLRYALDGTGEATSEPAFGKAAKSDATPAS
jgi:spore germination cell wall hydrolase CwlJ-like protein